MLLAEYAHRGENRLSVGGLIADDEVSAELYFEPPAQESSKNTLGALILVLLEEDPEDRGGDLVEFEAFRFDGLPPAVSDIVERGELVVFEDLETKKSIELTPNN
jgi:hypothetical protein